MIPSLGKRGRGCSCGSPCLGRPARPRGRGASSETPRSPAAWRRPEGPWCLAAPLIQPVLGTWQRPESVIKGIPREARLCLCTQLCIYASQAREAGARLSQASFHSFPRHAGSRCPPVCIRRTRVEGAAPRAGLDRGPVPGEGHRSDDPAPASAGVWVLVLRMRGAQPGQGHHHLRRESEPADVWMACRAGAASHSEVLAGCRCCGVCLLSTSTGWQDRGCPLG